MAIETISPQVLKTLRKQANLSQQGLAEISRVSKPTIARIELGKNSANTTTIERLAKALKVKPEELADNPKKDGESREGERQASGYRTLKLTVQNATALSFRMVELKYGLSQAQQIHLAPLFAALMAEASLVWRKKKIKKAWEAIDNLGAVVSGHPGFVIAAHRARQPLEIEQDSIDKGDVLGDKFWDDSPDFDNDGERWLNPFSRYLQHLTKVVDSPFIEFYWAEDHFSTEWTTSVGYSEWTTSVGFSGDDELLYSLGETELARLTGFDHWAETALLDFHIDIADIPAELWGGDATAERLAWLKRQIPQRVIDDWERREPEFDIFASARKRKEDSADEGRSNDE